MNRIDIARGIIFQSLRLQKDGFDDRLICQKKIYLLQALGIDLGYHFDWLEYGPYSKTLATYIYDNFDILNEYDFTKYKLRPNVTDSIKIVNDLEKENNTNLANAQWYELLGSLLFIRENFTLFEKVKKCERETVIDALIAAKPRYDEKQCNAAMACLAKYNF